MCYEHASRPAPSHGPHRLPASSKGIEADDSGVGVFRGSANAETRVAITQLACTTARASNAAHRGQPRRRQRRRPRCGRNRIAPLTTRRPRRRSSQPRRDDGGALDDCVRLGPRFGVRWLGVCSASEQRPQTEDTSALRRYLNTALDPPAPPEQGDAHAQHEHQEADRHHVPDTLAPMSERRATTPISSVPCCKPPGMDTPRCAR
jgi:hypothetical protein